MIDDPGPEQEHEECTSRDRTAGTEGDVAENVQKRTEPAETRRKRVGKLNQPVKHSVPPYLAASPAADLSAKRFSSASTIVFIFEPSDPLTMIASPARIAETTCASRLAELPA